MISIHGYTKKIPVIIGLGALSTLLLCRYYKLDLVYNFSGFGGAIYIYVMSQGVHMYMYVGIYVD